MKVKLISLKTKIPNLALMKLSAWHKTKGDQVSLDEPEPDIIYISSPFNSANDGTDRSAFFPRAKIEYGGYGFNNRQLPYEIEHLMPDYSIFDCGYSMGYTTRGCIRNCTVPPCIVPMMEGKLRRNSPVEEFHNPRHEKVMLLDNNILADKEWFLKNTDYIIDGGLILLEHGLDIRLVDEKIAEQLSNIRFEKQIHFALDSYLYVDGVEGKLNVLEHFGIKRYRLMFYLYACDNLGDLMGRFDIVNSWGCDPFVMPDVKASKEIRRFARFVNKRIYKVCAWENYQKNEAIQD